MKNDQGKPEHCRKCKIKDCVTTRQITYCFECSEYPCKQIKRLEKSYNTRYHASLIENSWMVKERGMDAFLEQQKDRRHTLLPLKRFQFFPSSVYFQHIMLWICSRRQISKNLFLARMLDAFQTLKVDGKLHHGSGTFAYGDWAVIVRAVEAVMVTNHVK